MRNLSFLGLTAVLVLAACGGSGNGTGSGGAGGNGAGPGSGGAGHGGAGTGGMGHGGASTGGGGSQASSTGGGGQGGSAGGALKTVFVILMENHNWSDIHGTSGATYIDGLLAQGAHCEQYYNPPGSHPSEPNYIWLEAGDNLGVTNDSNPSSNHQSTTDHLVTYLEAAGVSWKAYQEDISGNDCPLVSVNQYAPKHNPFIFFDDVTNTNDAQSANCKSHVRPYGELAGDLTGGTVARYNFITPNLCNDMHDCSVATGDQWLANEVPKILASSAYADGGALFITWDEGEGGDGPIGMIVMSPKAKVGFSSNVHHDHSSLLKTLQEIFGVTPLLRHAGDAATTDLGELFTSFP